MVTSHHIKFIFELVAIVFINIFLYYSGDNLCSGYLLVTLVAKYFILVTMKTSGLELNKIRTIDEIQNCYSSMF